MTWTIAATELAAHWRAYRRALKGNEGAVFAWTAIGYRIRAAGTALRDWMGFEPHEHCFDMMVIAGTLTFAGSRSKRQRIFYRRGKRMTVPRSSIPEPWDLSPFGLKRPNPSRKRFKKWRAIVRGNTVLIRYKNRDAFYKICEFKNEAELVAARINRTDLPVAKLKRTFKRSECPHCGKSVADNWRIRHRRMYHETATEVD